MRYTCLYLLPSTSTRVTVTAAVAFTAAASVRLRAETVAGSEGRQAAVRPGDWFLLGFYTKDGKTKHADVMAGGRHWIMILFRPLCFAL